MPPTGERRRRSSRCAALDGEPVKFAIEGLGWRQGSFHFEGLALPDGVAVFFGPVKLIIEEFGAGARSPARPT